MSHQPGIFVEGNPHHWFQEYRITSSAGVPSALRQLREVSDGATHHGAVQLVVAFGPDLAEQLLGADVPPELRKFDGVTGADRSAPATGADLFVWAHSDRRDRTFEVAHAARALLAESGELLDDVPAWTHRDGRDLTNFIDGTENPDASEGRELALVADGPGSGGALVFTQRWVHDLDGFDALPVEEQEAIIGRTKPDSVELDPVPENSHVGRVVITDDDGEEIEIYRRSMPYGTATEAGLFFLAFPGSLSVIDEMLARMFGSSSGEDSNGPHDRLTDFSQAHSGSFLFAPSLDALASLS